MTWQPLAKFITIPAKRQALWTQIDGIGSTVQVKIEVPNGNATWMYCEDRGCGPDGDLTSLIARSRCLCPGAPVGALIGKLGGSSAGTDDGRIFAVGSFCVVDVPENGGPLFLSINDEITGMSNNNGSLIVRIWQRPGVPAAASATPDPTPPEPALGATGSARVGKP